MLVGFYIEVHCRDIYIYTSGPLFNTENQMPQAPFREDPNPPFSRPLQEIDAVDWLKVSHAYGPTTDVPALFRRLLNPDPVIQRETWDMLYGNLFHQGQVFPASKEAVPFLFGMLIDPRCVCKAKLIYYLVHIAVGYSQDLPPLGYHLIQSMREEAHWKEQMVQNPPEDPIQKILWMPECDYQIAHNAIACYRHVLHGVPLFFPFLTDADHNVRIEAVYALSWFKEFAEQSYPKVWVMILTEKEPEVLLNALLSLAMLERFLWERILQQKLDLELANIGTEVHDRESFTNLLLRLMPPLPETPFLEQVTRLIMPDQPALVRLIAAGALAVVAIPRDIPKDAFCLLLRGLNSDQKIILEGPAVDPPLPDRDLSMVYHNVVSALRVYKPPKNFDEIRKLRLLSYVEEILGEFRLAVLEAHIDEMCHEFRAQGWPNGECLFNLMMERFFEETPESGQIFPPLTASQRDVLKAAISTRSIDYSFSRFGLPPRKGQLLKLLRSTGSWRAR